MTTVLEYIEEETGFIPDPDLPPALAKAELVRVVSAVFTFEVTTIDEDAEYEDEENYEEGTHPVLEITAETETDTVTFILISPNDEEWFYYKTIDEYVDETYYDNDDISYNYEVISDDDIS